MRSVAAILLYHRIAEARHDPFDLCVSPQTFARHLDCLAGLYQVLPLDELVTSVRTNHAPERGVALTFDDGYVDNLTAAAPLLDEFNFPASFFLTAPRTQTLRFYWWDRLASVVLETPSMPGRISLGISTDGDVVVDGKGDRLTILRSLHAHLRVLGAIDRDRSLRAIIDQCGEPALSEVDRAMLPDEVRALCRNPRHQVGAHTANHLSLPLHPEAVQEFELREARSVLQEVTGLAVDCVAYPFGDHDALTERLADRVGFTLGLTTARRALSVDDELLRLPRIEIKAHSPFEDVLATAFASS